jgi:hypothetical protein
MLLAVGLEGPALGKDQQQPLSRTFDVPVENVYAAVVQVATTGYNLKSAVKEGYSVNFFTGGQFSMVVAAVCRDKGSHQTIVTLSIAQAVGNSQLIGVGKAKNKLAARFWADLEATLKVNESLGARSAGSQPVTPPAHEDLSTISVKSTPDGAEITVDGKFSGSTPATLRLPAGDHVIRIASKGFQNWERTVTVTSGGTTTINADLGR